MSDQPISLSRADRRKARHARSRPGGQTMTDHAHELRRYARKIAHPAGDVPAVMRAAADEIERLQSMIAGLRADFETAHARMMTSAEREREACATLRDEVL